MEMTEAEIDIDAPATAVFDVLLDVRTYPDWLVGAKAIRAVEPGWPERGASFHHTVGAGPLTLRDKTTVLDAERPTRLELRAGMGPLGAARVVFQLDERDGRTHVAIDEAPEAGVVRLVWNTLGRALMKLGLWGRNAVSLQQLRSYVERSRA